MFAEDNKKPNEITDDEGEIDPDKASAYMQEKALESFSPKQGFGGDLGMLLFFQGRSVDTLFALKIFQMLFS